MSGHGAAARSLAAALVLALAAARGQSAPGLAALLQRIGAGAHCQDLRVLGPCHCGPLLCGLRVTQFVPVAFVETTRAPGDSLLGGMLPAAALYGTASSAISTSDNTAEAHVWLLTAGLLAPLSCATCAPADAARAPPAPAPAVEGGACAAAALPAPMPGPAAELPPASPAALAYASEEDFVNWRTGCRDLPAAPPPTCAAGVGANDCIGRWGPLKPRQMRDVGPTPVLYSAKTAVRAMSIAREQLGTFPYPVDTDGRLQQVYPATSDCFGVGALPLPRLATSADGRYGWVYWRPAACCLQAARLEQCLRAGVLGR